MTQRRCGRERAPRALRLRRRPSVRPGPTRRLRARIRQHAGSRSACTVLEPRDASDEELRSFHTRRVPRLRAERFRERHRDCSTAATRRRSGASTRPPPASSARRLSAMEAIMAGRVPPRLRADRRTASRRAQSRRGFLRVQRLRCGDRAAASAPDSSASPTSTSMRITAMACSTRSRMTPRWCSPTCTRTAATSIPAPARRGDRPWRGRRARSSMCRCRPARTMRPSPQSGRR